MKKVIVTAVLLLSLSTAFAADWASFLGPHGDGSSAESGLKLSWGEAGPPLVWEQPIGEGYTAPAIADGKLYAFDRWGDQARLTCRDASTGDEIWRSEYATDYEDLYDFSVGPRGAPVVDGDRVYTYGVEGKLRCHQTKDGKLLWEIDTVARYGVVQNFFGVGSTPLIEGDLLLVMVGGSPKESPKIHSGELQPNGSALVAFEKRSGKVRYQVGDELASYASPVVTTIKGRRWGFLFARGGLLGFEPSSGKIDFHFPWRAKKLESVNAANPVVVGDLVMITESYGKGSALLRVKPGGYELLRQDGRRDQSFASHWATPIHRDGVVYGCSGQSSGDATLRAIDLLSGELHWSQPGMGRSTSVWVDGHLVVLGERGKLYSVKATKASYQLVSESDSLVDYPAWSAPVIADGRLYIRGKKALKSYELKPPQ